MVSPSGDQAGRDGLLMVAVFTEVGEAPKLGAAVTIDVPSVNTSSDPSGDQLGSAAFPLEVTATSPLPSVDEATWMSCVVVTYAICAPFGDQTGWVPVSVPSGGASVEQLEIEQVLIT